MSSRLRMILFGGVIGTILAIALFSAGLTVGMSLPQSETVIIESPTAITPPTSIESPTETTFPLPTPSEDLETFSEPFWGIWEIIHDQFVDQPVDDMELIRGAIRGMLDALDDPYTSYMDPDEFTQANMPIEGSYEGIGAWVDPDGEFLTIISPMPNSPAEKAGLKPGDEVIAIDGEDMTGVDGNLVIRRVLGPAGSSVTLTIHREGEPELLEFEIIRETIILPSIESEMLEGNIAYIHLFTFGDDTVQDLRQTLDTLLAENPKGLILDLRFNGGGLLDTTIEVASEFISEGIIMTEYFGDGTEHVYEAQPGGLATEIPLVVLVNGGSASASEIVAGAIQDHRRGRLVGEVTYGKAAIQSWIPLPSYGGAIRITIARWLTPNGQQIHELGLTPDFEVLLTEEDIEAERDVQLEKAIELLTLVEE
ncbi:MAG: S41 family peptidase [Anaerolineales bacterium]